MKSMRYTSCYLCSAPLAKRNKSGLCKRCAQKRPKPSEKNCCFPGCTNRLGFSNKHGMCKEHRQLAPGNAESRARWHREVGYFRNKAKKPHYLSRYGVTFDWVQGLLSAQGFVCAMPDCNKMLDSVGRGRDKGHLDHCHVTGKIRGVLCGECNMGLGTFEKIRGAAERYLTLPEVPRPGPTE